MRRNVGGHADGNAGAAIDQQVGESGRKHSGFLSAAVVVRGEVDGVLVDVAHHFHCQVREAALGVARGGGTVVTRRPEVSLALHQWVAQHPRLGESHQRVVNRGVTVRVIVAHHIADHAGRLGEVAIRSVTPVKHRIDDTTVHGLEPIAHVGKCTRHDHAHRIVEIRPLHLDLEVDGIDSTVGTVALVEFVGGVDVVAHVYCPRLRCLGIGRRAHCAG